MFDVEDAVAATLIFTELSMQEGYANGPDERVTADLRALGVLVNFRSLWADALLEELARAFTHDAFRRATESFN